MYVELIELVMVKISSYAENGLWAVVFSYLFYSPSYLYICHVMKYIKRKVINIVLRYLSEFNHFYIVSIKGCQWRE